MEFLNNIIQKIIWEKELKSMEIIDIYNILQLNQIEVKVENKYAKIFLNAKKKFYSHVAMISHFGIAQTLLNCVI